MEQGLPSQVLVTMCVCTREVGHVPVLVFEKQDIKKDKGMQ